LESLIAGVFNFDGDIQKFAGDAFFAEWRVTPNRTLEECAKLAAICTCTLAKDLKNFPVTVSHGSTGEETIQMNFRCGLGIGGELTF
jgi:class 3 adenylate cyclase